MKKLSSRVYYVFSDTDSTVLIALSVHFNEKNVLWFDTVKQRTMAIEKIVDSSHQRFVFERALIEGGGIYTFVPMTLEIYNDKVKNNVLSSQEFTDQEKLFLAFEKTLKNAL